MKNTAIITDEQTLKSATTQYGTPIPIFDDGFGQLFIHRDSMGISGIVRARTWEDAYGICEDEFFPAADESWEELRAEYGKIREHVKIIRRDGVERECTLADYPIQKEEFVRWETRETTPETEEEQDEAVSNNALFQESFGFRPNGGGIYAKDLNGDYLDVLTAEMIDEMGITLDIETA